MNKSVIAGVLFLSVFIFLLMHFSFPSFSSTDFSPSCVVDWKCTEWSYCDNATQTRICFDANNCDNSSGKPTEMQNCSILNENSQSNLSQKSFAQSFQERFGTEKGKTVFILLVLFLLVLLVVGVWNILASLRKKKLFNEKRFDIVRAPDDVNFRSA